MNNPYNIVSIILLVAIVGPVLAFLVWEMFFANRKWKLERGRYEQK